MTTPIPPLPAAGSTNWYAHYSALDASLRTAGQLPDVGTPGTATAEALRGAFTASPAALSRLFAALTLRKLKPCRVAFAGSSTTEGIGATTAANRYVDQLVARLQLLFPSGGAESTVVADNTASFGTLTTNPGVHGYNAGLGSTDSASYLTATTRPRVAALNPRLLVHMVGANDYANGLDPAVYKSNLQSQLSALKSLIPDATLHVLVHTFQRTDLNNPVYPWSAYANALKAIAAADPDNVIVVDLTAGFRAVGIPVGLPRNVAAGGALVTDTLQRTASALGGAQTGQAWIPDGSWSLTSSGASCTAGSGLAYIDAGAVDMDVSASFTITSGSGALGLLVNSQDGIDRLVYYLNAGAWTLGKFDASANFVSLAQGATTTTGPVSHTMRVVSSGATLTLYLDGAQVGSYTLTAAEQTHFKAYTRAGLRFDPALTATVSNFSVKAVGATVQTVVDPFGLLDPNNTPHPADAGHAFLATELARNLKVLGG